MTETLFAHLFRALDLAIVERLSDGLFHMLTPAPAWLDRAFEVAPAGARDSIDGAFPFLEDVVHQAQGAWTTDGAPQVYGPFAASSATRSCSCARRRSSSTAGRCW